LPGPKASLEESISRLDPEKIYIENVRSVLGVTARQAQTICEAAVRQGVFTRRVEVLCPDGSVAASAALERELPTAVRCWNTEEGHIELEFKTSELRRNVYYQLNEPVPSQNR
jgi:hypothetical protein